MESIDIILLGNVEPGSGDDSRFLICNKTSLEFVSDLRERLGLPNPSWHWLNRAMPYRQPLSSMMSWSKGDHRCFSSLCVTMLRNRSQQRLTANDLRIVHEVMASLQRQKPWYEILRYWHNKWKHILQVPYYQQWVLDRTRPLQYAIKHYVSVHDLLEGPLSGHYRLKGRLDWSHIAAHLAELGGVPGENWVKHRCENFWQ